jgi:hypothetical protein
MWWQLQVSLAPIKNSKAMSTLLWIDKLDSFIQKEPSRFDCSFYVHIMMQEI